MVCSDLPTVHFSSSHTGHTGCPGSPNISEKGVGVNTEPPSWGTVKKRSVFRSTFLSKDNLEETRGRKY
ncbi:hypothetical protein EYF80_017812 [Liparis tanakae]|uniref:Uncharacterized protein n=1 Tax=Liparis tanakae TaxID=230148 RepID=A0A4Z2I3Y2_9TELE|nr:hypothetical protein EYF80_017812 [Liparis tanakae]